jgi:membrane protease YdiL (CAAX protease family)
MRLLLLTLVCNAGFSIGRFLGMQSDLSLRSASWSWSLLGFVMLVLCFAVLSQQSLGAALRRVRPLHNPWLETLPVQLPTRIVIALLSTSPCIAIFSPLIWAGVPPGQRLGALLATFELWVASVAVGLAVLSAFRRTLPSHRLPLLSAVGSGMSLVGWMGIIYAAPLGRMLGAVPVLSLWGRELSGDTSVPRAVHIAMWTLVSGGLAYYVATERRGYDRIEGSPPKRVRARSERALDLDRLERRLLVRQRAALVIAIFSVAVPLLLVLMPALFLVHLDRTPSTAIARSLVPFIFIYVAIFGVFNGSTQAGMAVIRDVAARPLLSTLPVSPSATLSSKTRLFSWLMLPSIVFMALLGCFLPVDPLGFIVRWLLFAATLWLATRGVVAIAFLVQGFGSTTPGAGMGNATLDSVLLTLPVAGVLSAGHPLGALPSLGALALVVTEARRAALRCVRWLDDTSLVDERTTLLWRALLAFAAFISVQSLAALLLYARFSSAPAGATSGAYLISALALVAYMLAHRSDLGGMRLLPHRVSSLILGGIGGVVTGGLAIVGRPWLQQMAERFKLIEPLRFAPSGQVESLLVIAAVGIAAPLVEEIYFRGWLQSALAERLPDRRAWVVPLAAFAFASVHPASSFPIVFLLGLVAGALYARTGALGPGIVTHAVHNAIVLWSASG